MKIHEIISDRNDSINEGLGKYVSGGLGKLLFSKGANYESAVKYLANNVDSVTGKLNMSVPGLSELIEKYGTKIIKAAEKDAKKTMKELERTKNSELFHSKIGDISSSLKQYATWIKNAGLTAIVGAPFYDYYQEINQGLSAVQSGEWSEQQFENYRKQRISVLVGKVAEQVMYATGISLGAKAIKGAGVVATFGLIRKVPGIAKIDAVANLTTGAAIMYFMNSVNTKEGSNAIANLMVQPLLGSKYTGSDVISTAADFIARKAKEAVTGQQSDDTSQPIPQQPSSTNQQSPQQPATQSTQPSSTTSTTADPGYVSSLEPKPVWSSYNKGN